MYHKTVAARCSRLTLLPSSSKRKINTDPNNTKWSRDTTTFGQKILRSQGWQPGQYLGAQDAPHSELHTSANASYIRVVLKDDMKGLGFNKAKEDEVTGLDVFSDLLSRLNGKSEEAIEGDKQARAAIKTNIWVERKYGPMRFVRGGLLVGDKLEEEEDSSSSSEEEVEEVKVEVVKKDKKRKAEEMESAPVKTEKKSKKQKSSSDEDEDLTKKDKKKDKKNKKEKKEKKSKKSKAAAESENESSVDEADKKKKKSKSKSKESSANTSEDEAKRLKKEKKKLKKAAAAAAAAAAGAEDTPADSGSSTPATGTSTPRNRNFVRSKFIAQKKQAFLDTKALNQVCYRTLKYHSFRQ